MSTHCQDHTNIVTLMSRLETTIDNNKEWSRNMSRKFDNIEKKIDSLEKDMGDFKVKNEENMSEIKVKIEGLQLKLILTTATITATVVAIVNFFMRG